MDFCKRNLLAALIAVLGLIVVAYVGVKGNLQLFFGVVVPYLALLIFFEGIIYRVIKSARSPVPFRIPTTAGQHQSLPGIPRDLGDKLDNPSNFPYTVGRMALEILTFRSLFRNTRSELMEAPNRPEGAKLVHWSYKWLWVGALPFHYAFLVIVIRHLRFFTEPVPHFINLLGEVDGFVQFFVPTVYLSGVVLVVAGLYLLGGRLSSPSLRYISLASDYFPLLANHTFNIGADQPYSVNELAECVAQAMGVKADIVHKPARNEVLNAYSSHEKVRQVFGERRTD